MPTLRRFYSFLGLMLSILFSAPCHAFDAEAHFRGKTIRLLIPTGPGGGRALYALPVAATE